MCHFKGDICLFAFGVSAFSGCVCVCVHNSLGGPFIAIRRSKANWSLRPGVRGNGHPNCEQKVRVQADIPPTPEGLYSSADMKAFTANFRPPPPNLLNQRTPQRRGKQWGGGAKNLMRRPPTENSSDPPHLGTLTPPIPFLVLSPLEIPRISLRRPPQKVQTAFGESPKVVSNIVSSRGFAFRSVLPPFFSSRFTCFSFGLCKQSRQTRYRRIKELSCLNQARRSRLTRPKVLKALETLEFNSSFQQYNGVPQRGV